MMNQNDFYVAIQFVLEEAMNQGWSLMKIEEEAKDAIDEFIGENETETEDLELDDQE